ncbi:MAG: GNAT family N-acetyltransferase [Actinomycetales bacterium]|nr:GNAT family N-acetyltransferase [Actinomycetales bacterium]
MQNDSGLPPHLTTRPLRHTDSRAVFELMAAHELDTVGEVAIEEADIFADWQRPSFDIESSTMGVFDGERLVAYGEHSRADRADAAVHPAYRGRGIGTWVAHWIVAKAAERGVPVVGMPVSAGSPGEVLLRGLGWRQRWESWILRLPEGVDIPAPPISPATCFAPPGRTNMPPCTRSSRTPSWNGRRENATPLPTSPPRRCGAPG